MTSDEIKFHEGFSCTYQALNFHKNIFKNKIVLLAELPVSLRLHFSRKIPFLQKKMPTLLLQSSMYSFDASPSNKSNLILQLAFVLVGMGRMGKECPKAAWVNTIGRHHSWIQFTSLLYGQKSFTKISRTKNAFTTKPSKLNPQQIPWWLEAHFLKAIVILPNTFVTDHLLDVQI